MLQDPNVERYVEQVMKPVLKQIKELKAEVELLKKALHKTDVIRSKPIRKPKKETKDESWFDSWDKVIKQM